MQQPLSQVPHLLSRMFTTGGGHLPDPPRHWTRGGPGRRRRRRRRRQRRRRRRHPGAELQRKVGGGGELLRRQPQDHPRHLESGAPRPGPIPQHCHGCRLSVGARCSLTQRASARHKPCSAILSPSQSLPAAALLRSAAAAETRRHRHSATPLSGRRSRCAADGARRRGSPRGSRPPAPFGPATRPPPMRAATTPPPWPSRPPHHHPQSPPSPAAPPSGRKSTCKASPPSSCGCSRNLATGGPARISPGAEGRIRDRLRPCRGGCAAACLPGARRPRLV
jgi:hypothetical protein